MNLNLVKTFIKVAEFGSFTKAAQHLKQPKSRVSRSIARLEEELEVELIKRTTRSTALTEAGKQLYQSTHQLFYELESKVESINNEGQSIAGTLSISAPIDFGENIVPKLLSEFSTIHPQLEFRVILSDAYLDLTAHDIDLALRVGNLKDSALKHQKLSTDRLILVATPEYLSLNGHPKTWSEISRHSLLSFHNENQQDPLGEMYQKYGISPLVRSNSFPLLKRLAFESKGIAILPNVVCKKEINEGKLIRVLPDWANQKSSIQIVFSSTKNLPPRTRAFIDFIKSKKDLFTL